MLLLKVTTFKPIRRIVLIRFTFSLYVTILLMMIFIGSTVWITRNCELREIIVQNQQSQHFVRVENSKNIRNFSEIFKIKEAKRCFLPRDNRIYDGINLLEDVLDSGKRPTPGKSIFFHETSCTKNGIVVLNPR